MLETIQNAFMAALDRGPAHMQFDLFAHTAERALLGMKVHANTISHARLVALEDTFPRTRALLGDGRFNRISRDYLERSGVAALGLNSLGRDFPLHLAVVGRVDEAADLAGFEWAWLTSYNAADAPALALAELAELGAEELLTVVLARHPAALLGPTSGAVCRELSSELPELASADSILLTRPNSSVVARGIDLATAILFRKLGEPRSIGNLFDLCNEPANGLCAAQDRFMPALIDLIDTGAVQKVA